MFRFTQEFIDNAWDTVRGRMEDKAAYNKGIGLLEKLINIPVEKDGFGINEGENLCVFDAYNSKDLKGICKIEEFIKKLLVLRGRNDMVGGTMGSLYGEIGFWDRTKENDVRQARKNDPLNRDLSERFHLGVEGNPLKCNPDAYISCGNYFADYVRAYNMRNIVAHVSGEFNDMSKGERGQYYTSLLVVYLDQCALNEQIINRKYNECVIKTAIDYREFATKARNEMNQKDKDLLVKQYVQLNWISSQENVKGRSENCIKYIGEAGAGKTTKMLKCYWDSLNSVMSGKKLALPVWICLKTFNGMETYSLKQAVMEHLDINESLYDDLLSGGVIELYLDGYNEVLSNENDRQSIKKRTLAFEIDQLHKQFPEMVIHMTDRVHKSSPACLQVDVTVYQCAGMSRKEVLEYCRKKGISNIDGVEKFLADNEKSKWIERITLTPGKAEKLIELVNDGIFPVSDAEFYEKYLDYIMEREQVEKYETRIDILNDMLEYLAEAMKGKDDAMSERDIRTLWAEKGRIDREVAADLLRLAKELPILVKDEESNLLKFENENYYDYYMFRNCF